MKEVNVVLIHPNAKIPTKNHEDDLGWDICCVAEDNWMDYKTEDGKTVKGITLMKGESHTFHTGFKMSGQGFLLRDRSGLGCKDIVSTAGVIDAGYTGEWMVHLINLSRMPYTFYEGDKIIQAIPTNVIPIDIKIRNSLEETARAEKGFASSGR